MQAYCGVEGLHFFVATGGGVHSSIRSDQMEQKINTPISHLSGLEKTDDLKDILGAQLRVERADDLSGSLQLLTAFLGILLQNPKVFCLNITMTITFSGEIFSHRNMAVEQKRPTRLIFKSFSKQFYLMTLLSVFQVSLERPSMRRGILKRGETSARV